jgi:DNA-binding SARP family transcriptional activator
LQGGRLLTTRSRREPADARAFEGPGEASGWLSTLFEDSPFGLVVTGRQGLILNSNRRATEMLFPRDRSNVLGTRCCDSICEPLNRQHRGGQSTVCLTERARATGGALPEARLEVDMGGVQTSVWVTASPIDCSRAGAVVYLRPENPSQGDPRTWAARRVETKISVPPELRIHTFGRTRVEVAGRNVGGDWLHQRPGQLLEYLVCARHRLATSEQIAEAFWPGRSQPWSTTSVRHQVHALREKLDPDRDSDTPSRFIVTQRGGYMLDPKRVWIDADEFEDKVRTGLTLFVNGEGQAAMAPMEQALDLYQGDFLSDDPYAEWALEERDRLRELAGRGLRAMLSHRRSAGDLDAAAEHARRLAEMEPFDMDVQREFLEICIERGRHSEAMRRYALIRRRVRREFGHDPDFTLADLSG